MKQLSLSAGAVHGVILTYQQHGCDMTTAIGSFAWFSWLEGATSFTFRAEEDYFTAHKTQAGNRRGSSYWRATRRRHGRLYSFYLGQSAKLTLERLRTAAHNLAGCTDDAAPLQLAPPIFLSSVSRDFFTGADPLLVTKLHIPRLPMQHVSRPRLLTLLEQSTLQSVTLVSAPAGSGKTTLLAEWASTTLFPVAWLSCDSAENDPTRFLSYFMAALASLDERLGTAVQTSRSWHAPEHEQVLTGLLNHLERLLQQDTVVILDDAHLLTTDTVQAALHFLLDHLPARLHLIIGTRVDPPLPLARLRARGQLGELRSEELCFVSAEVEAFVQAMGLALSGEAKSLLEQCTEGWIAGIQLLALALRGQTDTAAFLRTFGGNHRFLLDYVSEEVLVQQTPEIHRFLLRTCMLERLCGPLCDAVTAEPGSQAKLSALLRANLFVSVLDTTQTWYRYHPLFAEALRAHLHKREPELVPELYRRASCWYEEHQDAEAACEYAFLASDLPRAANLLAELVTHLLEQGRVEQLGTWLDQLPQAEIAASPQLSAALIGMQSLRTPEPEPMEHLLERMQQQVQAQPQDAASWVELQSELILRQALAAFSLNDFPRALTLLHEALCALSTQETALSQLISLRLRTILSLTYRASGDLAASEQVLLETCMPKPSESYDPLNLGTAGSLANLYEAQGQLLKRGALYERVFQALRPGVALPPLVLALAQGSRAALWYEWNRLPEASHLVQQALSLAEQMGQAVFSVFSTSSLWTQARIDLAQGHTETVRQLLDRQAQPLVQMPLVEREVAPWAAIRARLALACDQVEEAWQWERTCGRRFDDRPGPDLSGACYFEYVTLARVLIARGRLQGSSVALSQGLHLLDQLRDFVVRAGLHGWFLEIEMLRSLAWQAQGKTRQAFFTLGVVLAQAEPEGYVRLFADEGQPMAHLLAQVAPFTSASPSYLQRCLQAVPPSQDSPSALPHEASYQPLMNPLSVREQEVLHLLAAGASNQQIADRLVICLETAKRHVRHILAKLSVINRTQAAIRAHTPSSLRGKRYPL